MPETTSVIEHLARIAAQARDIIWRVDEVIRQLRQNEQAGGPAAKKPGDPLPQTYST
jgi:hypothetical protein